MSGLVVKEYDSIEKILRIFRKQTEKGGVLSEVKRRQYYEKPCVYKKKKKIAAQKRLVKSLRRFGRPR